MTTLGETAPLVEDEFTVQAQITKTQSIIKQMKKESEAADLIAAQVAELLRLRAKLAEMKLAQQEPADTFNRRAFDELILRKMYALFNYH